MEKLWNSIKKFSIWRVPNYFIEPSGAFLGERVQAIDRLNKLRSCAAIAIAVGTAVYYSGLKHLGTVTSGKNGVKYFNIGNHNPEGNWFLGLLFSVVIAMLVLPFVSLGLIWWTKSGARRAALVQLRWPCTAIAGCFGILAVTVPFVALSNYMHTSSRQMGFSIKVLVWMLMAFASILMVTWIVKVFYLAAVGIFRAEDGHPLLPLIIAPITAVSTAVMQITVGSNGLVGVPGLIGDGLTWGGAATIVISSLLSTQVLRRRYPGDFPFRNGPLWR